ncbi:MAG: VanZ family protein, partial [Gammaproteobacteria bacterium]
LLSLLPDAIDMPERINGILDLEHVVAYGVLTGCWLFAWEARLSPTVITIGIFAYSCMLELVQGVIPGRDPEWIDVVANGIGVFTGWLATRILHESSQRPK